MSLSGRGVLVIAMASTGLILVFQVFPALYSLALSFYDAHLLKPETAFAGLGNYRSMFLDRDFAHALYVSLKYVVATLSLSVGVGLFLASQLRRPGVWSAVMRIGFVMPFLLPKVVWAVVWGWFFDPYFGPVNQALAAFGVSGPAWLKDPAWALTGLVVMGAWREMGLAMLIYLAAFMQIPPELEAAARLDGATGRQVWRHIRVPLLVPATLLILVTAGLRCFELFSPVYVLTGGGPASATSTWSHYLYVTSFERFQIGYGSAMAVAVGAVLALVLWISHGEIRSNVELS